MKIEVKVFSNLPLERVHVTGGGIKIAVEDNKGCSTTAVRESKAISQRRRVKTKKLLIPPYLT